MSAATHQLSMPQSVMKEARRLADEDGVSLDTWIAVAVAQKIGAIDNSEEFFRRHSRKVSQARMLEILRMAPDSPAIAGDELPEGYTSTS